MAKAWQFISTNNTDGKVGREDRQAVRKAAMRAFRQSQRAEHLRRLQEAEDSSDFEPYDAGTTTPVLSDSDLVLPLPLDSGARRAFDPFGATPLSSHPQAPMLFAHFIYNIVPAIQPFRHQSPQHPLSTILVKHTLTDPLFVEAVLFHAAMHLDVLQRGRPSSSSLYHQGRLIHLVNERLRGAAAEDTATDALILGVGLLGACGNLTGDVARDAIHREALQRMIRVRGGLEHIGCQGTLAILLTIGDLISVTIAGIQPAVEYPRIDTADLSPVFDPLGDLSILTDPSNLSPSNPQTAALQIPQLIQVLSRLVALYRQSYTPLSANAADMLTFIRLSCAIEHRLLSLKLAVPDDDYAPTLIMCEAARLAALMCSMFLFRRLGPGGAAFTKLQSMLRRCVVALDILGSEEVLPSQAGPLKTLFLWAMCVGKATAPDPGWYAGYVARWMSGLGIEGVEELTGVLSRYLWETSMKITV